VVGGRWSVVRITRPLKILTILSFIAFVIAACVPNETKRRSVVIAESKSYEASLFRQNCAICHGAEGNGKETNGVMTPSLRYGDATTKTEEEIYTQIKEGKLPMPAFKNQLSDKEIRGMVNFIMYDLQGREKLKAEK
jgi:cytochrome c553